LTLTLTHLFIFPELMFVLILPLIFPTLESHSNLFVYTAWPNDFTSLTVILPHSWLSLLTHMHLLPDQMISPILLLIFPTFDSYSNSFVSIAWPNDCPSLSVNLPHSWLSLLTHMHLLPDQMISLVLLLIFPTFYSYSNSFVSIAWLNYFTSLTVNLPHSWLSL
jgi:hypothetical protein